MAISPESRPAPSQFDNDDVRDALESFRRAVDLGDNPLRNLVLVWQRVESAELTASLDAIDLAVRDVLYELIRKNLSRMRQLDGRDEPDDSRKAQLSALVDDWQSGNAELRRGHPCTTVTCAWI